MKTLISSRYQLVLGVTAISVFLLSGFIVTTSRIPVRPPRAHRRFGNHSQ